MGWTNLKAGSMAHDSASFTASFMAKRWTPGSFATVWEDHAHDGMEFESVDIHWMKRQSRAVEIELQGPVCH